MRDYEELVKRLRSVKDTWQTAEEQWMLDAAEAIEELKTLKALADAKIARLEARLPELPKEDA